MGIIDGMQFWVELPGDRVYMYSLCMHWISSSNSRKSFINIIMIILVVIFAVHLLLVKGKSPTEYQQDNTGLHRSIRDQVYNNVSVNSIILYFLYEVEVVVSLVVIAFDFSSVFQEDKT